MGPRIPTVDLFSGIGGFSLALKDMCKTVAYCDIDPMCRDMLQKRISDKSLDKAPIFQDIRNLQRNMLPVMPIMLTGGFPCSDVSCAQYKGAGIDGLRSGIVKDVYRLLDELPSVKYVLLENSPCLMTRGLDYLIEQFRKRNFRTVYGVFSADDVGAPQLRKRLYLFAYRQPLPPFKFTCVHNWNREPSRRIIPKLPEAVNRCKMLSNSVVPQTVLYACSVLSAATHDHFPAIKHQRTKHDVIFADGAAYSKPTPPNPYRNKYTLHFADSDIQLSKHRWTTPIRSQWSSCLNIKGRCFRKLYTQLVFERKTQHVIKQEFGNTPLREVLRQISPNPQFVEWIMGYPKDWTK